MWTNQCVDVEALESRANRAEETCRILSKKVTQLQKQLHKLQLERLNEYNSDRNQQFSDIEVFKDDPKRSKVRMLRYYMSKFNSKILIY